jgi:ABC-2 type transport system ATP-binding protein
MLGLSSFLERPVRQLSLGQRMRCEIVMSLLHDPKILFLDEPTIGLDVVAKDAVRRFLADINRERGVTIILTTHDLQDIEQICPRLIMVDEGRLLFDGALANLRASLGTRRRLRLEFEREPEGLQLPDIRLVSDEGAVKHFLIEREDLSLVEILGAIPKGYGLRDAKLEEPGIEEVIRTFYVEKPMAAP